MTKAKARAVGRTPEDPRVWAARVETGLAVFIRRLLREDPPPCDCAVARDLRDYAELLQADGQARLAAVGARRLRRL